MDSDGVFDPQPPVGILKKNAYVSAEEEEAGIPPEGDKQGKPKRKKVRRKLVPVWRLVSYSTGSNFHSGIAHDMFL